MPGRDVKATLHPLFSPPDLAVMGFFLEHFALVGFFPHAAEAKFYLDETIFHERAERDKHVALFLQAAGQLLELGAFEQEPARAILFIAVRRVLRLVGRYVRIHEPCFDAVRASLASANHGARAGNLKTPALCAFHFMPQKLDAGFIGFRNVVIEPRSAVLGDSCHPSIIYEKGPR